MTIRLSTLVFLLLANVTSTGFAEWHLRWKHTLPERKPAWQYTQRMPRDVGYTPTVAGGNVYVGCEHNGALLALDAKTGAIRWKHFTNGPIRVGVVGDKSRVLVGSDDGVLYCLNHAGELQWTHRGGPSARKVIGHERVISAWPVGATPLLDGETVYYVSGYWPVDGIVVHALDVATGKVRWANGAGQFRPRGSLRLAEGKLVVDGFPRGAVFDAKTGHMLDEKTPKAPPKEQAPVAGPKGDWSVEEDVLAVGTQEGVYCYSKRVGKPITLQTKHEKPSQNSAQVQKILEETGELEGYAFVVGLKDGTSIEALLQQSKLHIVATDSDRTAIDRIRARLDQRGCYLEHRLDLIVAESPKDFPLYIANLIVSETSDELVRQARQSLRPYGGALVFQEEKFQVEQHDGPLPGASDWRQEFCDAANTLASKDKRVKAPLGLLWYGGVAADARFYFDGNVDHQSGHGLNPQPVPAQIVEGRMILQSQGRLSAIDIYTGRLLWETNLPKMYSFGGSRGGLGIHSRKHPKPWEHAEAWKAEIPPTHHCRASGFNFVSLPDSIYICAAQHLLRIDPNTGETLARWPVPIDSDEKLCWGGIRTTGNYLVTTVFRPQDLVDARAGHDGNGGDWAGDRMPMRYLVVLDRKTGKLLWHHQAAWGFLNRSGFVLGGGRVYCVDALTSKVLNMFNRAARDLPKQPPMLYAFDLATGKEVWQRPLDVYVQNLVYSEERDVLLVPCRNLMAWEQGKWVDHAFDAQRKKRNKQTPGKLQAITGNEGKLVWEQTEAPYHTPHILLDDLLIDRYGISYDLRTGKRHQRVSPLTGEAELWSFRKGGCNHLIACENLVTWRCAYYDLEEHRGVLKLTGMDAGCAPTLIPAGGVLNLPNFGTHHKRNRMTAMALVHRPKNALWTAYATSREKFADTGDWYRHVGYNFGAIGDRTEKGLLWLQVASNNGNGVKVQPKEVTWHKDIWTPLHLSVAGTGVTGVQTVSLPTQRGKPTKEMKRYTVRLHFSKFAGQGESVLTVEVEGKPAVENLVVSQPIVREIRNVVVQGPLDIRLTASKGETTLSGVELVLER